MSGSLPRQLCLEAFLEFRSGKAPQLRCNFQHACQAWLQDFGSKTGVCDDLIDCHVKFLENRMICHNDSFKWPRSVCKARNCNCLMAPSERPSSFAISRTLFWSTKRSTITES